MRAEATAAAIGGGAVAIRADVASESEVEAAFARVDAELGPVEICFANAGIAGAGGALDEYTLADWNEVTGIDLDGVFLTVRAAVRRMAPRGYGKVVITAPSTRCALTRSSAPMFSEEPEAVELRDRIAARVPLGVLGEASELKGLALFLAAPASDYVTGAAIPVDGGWIAT